MREIYLSQRYNLLKVRLQHLTLPHHHEFEIYASKTL